MKQNKEKKNQPTKQTPYRLSKRPCLKRVQEVEQDSTSSSGISTYLIVSCNHRCDTLHIDMGETQRGGREGQREWRGDRWELFKFYQSVPELEASLRAGAPGLAFPAVSFKALLTSTSGFLDLMFSLLRRLFFHRSC